MAEDCQYVYFSDSSELLPLVCLFVVVFLNVAMSVKLPIKLMRQTHLSAQIVGSFQKRRNDTLA